MHQESFHCVKMRHHRGDQACAVDTVGLNIKGLNKYNMPQSGDVMVPVPQIQEQNVDVGGQEQVIVREIPEVLVVERIQERKNDRYLEDVKRAFAGWGKRQIFWGLDGTQFLLCAGRGRRVLCQFILHRSGHTHDANDRVQNNHNNHKSFQHKGAPVFACTLFCCCTSGCHV